MPFQPVPVPALGLSEADKQCIRDRSCIMARHILADQPEEYIQAQVNFSYICDWNCHGPYKFAHNTYFCPFFISLAQ